MATVDKARWTTIVTAGCAGLAAAIAAVVLVGWNIGSEALIAVEREFIPAQYNTALAFLCCSVAALALLRQRRWVATVSTAAAAAIAVLTGIEYLAGVDLQIDTLFFHGLVGAHVSGRLAPNTVVGFLCATAALLLLAWPRIPRAIELAASLAAVVGALGVVALTGYVAGIPPAYQWLGGKPVAVLSTAAFLALSAATFSLAWHCWAEQRDGAPAPGSRPPGNHPMTRKTCAMGTLGNVPPWLASPVFTLLMATFGVIAKIVWDTSRIAILPHARLLLVFSMALLLLFGAVVSTALAGLIRLAQSAQRRSRELQTTQAELQQLNRALRLVSDGHHLLAHATDEPDLLQRLCRLAADQGGYRLAWIGFAEDDEAKSVRIVARAGPASAYLREGIISWADEPRGRGPTGTAIRTAQSVTCPDVLTDASFLPWRDRAVEFGFRSTLVIPLVHDGRVLGALSIYADEPEAFPASEIDLFQQLADDLAFGILALRNRRDREAAEEEIFRLNRALQALSKCSQALLHARDRQQLVDEICRIVVEVGGYRMAWVAAAPPAPGDGIRSWASYGAAGHYIETLCLRYNASANGSLLVPTALRTGKPAVCRDTATDPRSASLRDECRDLGFASIIALPLAVEGKTIGALAIYATERDAFDAAEVALLTDLAATVSFGIEKIEARAQKELAEQKLRDSERSYRTLFERNLAGVFRARADTTVLEANGAFLHMLGYENSADAVDLRLVTLGAAAGFIDPWPVELAATGQLINREMRVLRRDGSIACLLANLVLLRGPDDTPESIEGTVLDITERRQLEAQLLQSQKMEAIGQLAGGIAHDFNNLLMVIRSYAELIAEKTQAGGAPDEGLAGGSLAHDLDAIRQAADRGAALTRQLLTFGRKGTPGGAFSPRLLDINSVLDTLTQVLPRALGEDVRVELRGQRGLWQVKADPVQVEQLVLNLAVNARDAMPAGGRLTLETSNVSLDAEYAKLHAGVLPGDYVLLAVSDTGHGIAPEVLPRIFEPFFTTKERGKGTGLGLSTVYGIVQQSGGSIWVYSEPEEGTVFRIYLPRAGAATAAARPPVCPDTPASGAETILLVEDEEAVRTAARTYLALRGYHVLEAGCGEEALRISDHHPEPIAALITDAVMPGMSGSELARQVAARRPAIRVIYVSGYTEATVGERGMLPNSTFLQKPFSLAALARQVRETLDRHEERRVA